MKEEKWGEPKERRKRKAKLDFHSQRAVETTNWYICPNCHVVDRFVGHFVPEPLQATVAIIGSGVRCGRCGTQMVKPRPKRRGRTKE